MFVSFWRCLFWGGMGGGRLNDVQGTLRSLSEFPTVLFSSSLNGVFCRKTKRWVVLCILERKGWRHSSIYIFGYWKRKSIQGQEVYTSSVDLTLRNDNFQYGELTSCITKNPRHFLRSGNWTKTKYIYQTARNAKNMAILFLSKSSKGHMQYEQEQQQYIIPLDFPDLLPS